MTGLRVPLVRPALGEDEVESVSRTVRSGWVTQGPMVKAFEEAVAETVGAPHAVAVSNCTVAMELALRVAGIGPGDEVITASHSFVATANAITHVGATPVFVDVREATLNIDPAAVEEAVTSSTKAVLCVHQLGVPADLESLVAICGRHDLALIEDAACAIGSELTFAGAKERVGRPRGRFACFSFHPRKVITCGDGGVITTDDEGAAQELRLMRQHAMSISDVQRHGALSVHDEEYLFPAFNARLTDLQAALALPQLARLDAILDERRAIAARYREALAESPVLAPPPALPGLEPNWQSFAARLRPGAGLDQRSVRERLLAEGVATKPGVTNAHQEPAYAHLAPRHSLAVSERMRESVVMLPLFHGMTDEEEAGVLEAVSHLARERTA